MRLGSMPHHRISVARCLFPQCPYPNVWLPHDHSRTPYRRPNRSLVTPSCGAPKRASLTWPGTQPTKRSWRRVRKIGPYASMISKAKVRRVIGSRRCPQHAFIHILLRIRQQSMHIAWRHSISCAKCKDTNTVPCFKIILHQAVCPTPRNLPSAWCCFILAIPWQVEPGRLQAALSLKTCHEILQGTVQ